MKADLQPVVIFNGQHSHMPLPELVTGVHGDITVVVDEDALAPGQHVYIALTYEIDVRGENQ
jgi:hypothetical protein